MAKFSDRNGKVWKIEFTVAAAKRMKDAGYDLTRALDADGEFLSQLRSDPVYLVDAIYEACKTQAEAEGVTPEEFGEGLYGKSIDDATEAFLDELVVFSRGRGQLLSRLVAKTKEMEAAGMQRAMTALEKLGAQTTTGEPSTKPQDM